MIKTEQELDELLSRPSEADIAAMRKLDGDLMLLADPQHEPAIRQGVTTYLIGQDGVAMAPASPATLDFMRRYTAGFSGIPDLPDRWSGMAEYLALFDGRTALNVACLVPNGNVRMEVMGLDTRPPTPDELKRMGRLVREAIEEGAVGLSSGLDYIPSRYADTEELIALCKEIAPFGGVYVTHMRRYDPEGVLGSMDEVYRIGREAGVAVTPNAWKNADRSTSASSGVRYAPAPTKITPAELFDASVCTRPAAWATRHPDGTW